MQKRASLVLILMCSFSLAHAKVILWDLGGVLFETDRLGVAFDVGITNFISHAFWDLRSPNIQDVLFDVLNLLDQDERESQNVAGASHGGPLPPIMCKWQAGTITGEEIIKRSKPLIEKLYKYDYFDSKEQMELIQRCIKTMFNPALLAKNIHPCEPIIALMKESYRMVDKDGKKVHRQFVLSNFDHLSYDILYNEHRHLFRYFEGIVISGKIKCIKPNRDAFKYLLDTYSLDPQECILIDDQVVNARTARKCGMKVVLIQNRDYEQLRLDLKYLGVIP